VFVLMGLAREAEGVPKGNKKKKICGGAFEKAPPHPLKTLQKKRATARFLIVLTIRFN
jgi:hypothetical protein